MPASYSNIFNKMIYFYLCKIREAFEAAVQYIKIRTDTIFWLMLSQRPTHVQNAVKLYRDMQLAEEAVREEVLRGN